MTRAYIRPGSDVNAEGNLERALALLAREVSLEGGSEEFESAPVGDANQACFPNAVAAIEPVLPPGRLRYSVLRPIDAALGRVRSPNKLVPRAIDLDIILYRSRVLACRGRRIPDLGLLREVHVACPMADLGPQIVHPETGETVKMIARRVGCSGTRLRA